MDRQMKTQNKQRSIVRSAVKYLAHRRDWRGASQRRGIQAHLWRVSRCHAAAFQTGRKQPVADVCGSGLSPGNIKVKCDVSCYYLFHTNIENGIFFLHCWMFVTPSHQIA